MSRMVVTGGAGFIGSHLADALIARGHEVFVIDDLSTGSKANLPKDAEWVEMDICDSGLADAFRRFRPEIVYHHAAQVSVASSMRDPMHDARVNILGTLNVLDAAVRSGARKLVYASSAAVYGMPETEKLPEAHPVRPLSFYGISKHTPEHYIDVFGKLHGLDHTVLRYSNVFGSRQDAQGEGGVVSIFADRLKSGARPIIYGDGEQTRDFIHVSNVVAANLAAEKRGSGLTINVSCGSFNSVNELLRTMCGLCGRPFEPIYEAERPGDIRHSLLDNAMARRELGWEPTVTLTEGLRETLDGYGRRAPA